MRFEFATSARIVFGPGTLKQIGGLVRGFGKHALVVTGSHPQRAEPLCALLESENIETTLFPIPSEPTIDSIIKGTQQARHSACDFVIGFGGGSAMDAAKAIAAMLRNDGELLDYLEVIGRGLPLAKNPVPCVAIPTTAGSGAEVTRNAVLASPAHQFKASLRSPLILPRLAVVDPELACDLPPAITASTGLDALTQLIEPYVSCRSNPMTDAICVEGMRRAARALPIAFRDGRAASAREDMALASLFGGMALANAGLGGVHGFAAPIGGQFDAPHGAICAALLPHVVAMNLQALRARAPQSDSLRRYDAVARLLTGDLRSRAEDGVAWLRDLVTEFHIPKLGHYGIRQEHAAELVEKATRSSSMKANPIELTTAELTEVLQAAM